MIQLDLFSGAGMFSLAGEWVWGAEHKIKAFCDIDPFCQKLLKLRFPGTKIYGDIRSIKNIGPVDILTGGFPCQPFSVAGKQEGKEDNRFLWPEMLRIIKECGPTWVIGENVAGIINMALDEVLSDLEAEGYTVRTFVIPACAVGAPHRRDRVWIVAYRSKSNDRGHIGKQEGGQIQQSGKCDEQGDDTNPSSKGLEGGKCKSSLQHGEQSDRNRSNKRRDWNQNWLEVATELCGVDDGLPAELDGLKLSKSKHRTERLKALGNAIVPQVAYEIMRTIKAIS